MLRHVVVLVFYRQLLFSLELEKLVAHDHEFVDKPFIILCRIKVFIFDGLVFLGVHLVDSVLENWVEVLLVDRLDSHIPGYEITARHHRRRGRLPVEVWDGAAHGLLQLLHHALAGPAAHLRIC